MPSSKIRVIYHCCADGTQILARELAAELDCGVEKLVDRNAPWGVQHPFRSRLEAALGRRAALLEPHHDPASFDLIPIGTPILGRSMSSAVRSYLELYRGQFPRVAFFALGTPASCARAFEQMREAGAIDPVAVLCLSERDLDGTGYVPILHAFAERLHGVAALDRSAA